MFNLLAPSYSPSWNRFAVPSVEQYFDAQFKKTAICELGSCHSLERIIVDRSSPYQLGGGKSYYEHFVFNVLACQNVVGCRGPYSPNYPLVKFSSLAIQSNSLLILEFGHSAFIGITPGTTALLKQEEKLIVQKMNSCLVWSIVPASYYGY
jgi:hypothetical protein